MALRGCLVGPGVATAPAPCHSPAPSCNAAPAPACARRLPSHSAGRWAGCRKAARLAAAAGGSSGGGGGGASEQESSVEAAFAAVQSCMALFTSRQSSGDLDSVVEFLPEAVIDRLLERKRAKREEAGAASAAAPSAAPAVSTQPPSEELAFEELVALAQPTDLALDAYSARGLLNAAPRCADVLSSLRLAPDRFLQRYSVVAQSGEEMVLTIDMQLQESLQPKYRGLQLVHRWFLRGITGEPAYPGDLPAKPEPCWGPEAVVLAQLAALQQGDAEGVFRFASPENQAATGPVERFQGMLQSPGYRPLLQHEAAEVLRTVQMQPNFTLCIIGVRSNIPTAEPGVSQRLVYSWSLRLQGGEAGPEFENCWMTESVQPISQNLI